MGNYFSLKLSSLNQELSLFEHFDQVKIQGDLLVGHVLHSPGIEFDIFDDALQYKNPKMTDSNCYSNGSNINHLKGTVALIPTKVVFVHNLKIQFADRKTGFNELLDTDLNYDSFGKFENISVKNIEKCIDKNGIV